MIFDLFNSAPGSKGSVKQGEEDLKEPVESQQHEIESWTLELRAAAFSSYDGDLSLPLGLALGSP